MKSAPGGSIAWEDLKRELAARFGDIVDPQYALARLQKEKQRKDESVQFFAERLMTLAEDAFPDTDVRNDAAIERQLIQVFVDGLCLDTIKVKLLRENPERVQRAVEIATKEQDLLKKIDVRLGRTIDREDSFRRTAQGPGIRHDRPNGTSRREEPMDIDAAGKGARCYLCHSPRHIARDCAQRETRPRHTTHRFPKRVSEVARSQMQCWHCHRYGHVRRQCPALN